jgi:hypothetical protein
MKIIASDKIWSEKKIYLMTEHKYRQKNIYFFFFFLKKKNFESTFKLMETEFSKLNISGGDSNHKSCSYCNKPFTEELWCTECDPYRMMEECTSGNSDIDKLIKETMYYVKNSDYSYEDKFLEWVPFDRFTDVEEIGEGGFAKVYSATWIDGKSEYNRENGSWKKKEPEPTKVALKRLNGSQNISDKYLNEVRFILN